MDLQTRKLELIQAFLKIKSETLISKIEDILKTEYSSYELEEVKPMSVNEFNTRIDRSIKDSENNNLIESNDLKSKIDQWN